MVKKIVLILSVFMLAVTSFATNNVDLNAGAEDFRYDIEYCQTAADGMVMVKVWSYAKKANNALALSRVNAVHGVIFRGYASSSAATSQRPLVSDPTIESTKADFFEAFFKEDGPYLRYVSTVLEGSEEVRKVGKEYKVGVVVTVNKDMLRKHLEQAGVVRGLGSGF
jgi:hypothetical protein